MCDCNSYSRGKGISPGEGRGHWWDPYIKKWLILAESSKIIMVVVNLES